MSAIIKALGNPLLIEIGPRRIARDGRKSPCPYFAQIRSPNDYLRGLMKERISRLAIALARRVMAYA